MTDIHTILIPVIINSVALGIAFGKASNRIANLEKRFDEETIRNTKEAESIQEIQMEANKLGVALWGIDGNNGLRSQVRDVIGKVEQIQRDINTISINHYRMTDAIEQINKKLDK